MSKDNVFSIRGGDVRTEAEVDVSVIRMLEQTLERARSGEFAAAAVCAVQKDRRTGSSYVMGREPHLLIAAVDILHHMMIDSGEPRK